MHREGPLTEKSIRVEVTFK